MVSGSTGTCRVENESNVMFVHSPSIFPFLFDKIIVPLPASEAHKYPAAKLKEEISNNGKFFRVHGQRLRGEMILTIEDPVIESTVSAAEASATKSVPPSLAKHRDPAKETDPLLS